MSKRIGFTLLLCGALYLLGNGRVSLWDRDEPRYAQASRQMLASGDWVVPQLLDQPRINKPPLIYWCQAAAMRVLGDNAFAARLPSSVAMVLTLVMLAVVLVRWVGEERAFWAVLIFGTSGLVVMAAKMCLTDAVLLLFVTASQFCLYAMWRGRGTWPVVIGFAVSTGLGLLTKGPVVLGVNGMTLVVLGVMRLVDVRRREVRGFEAIVQNEPIPRVAPVLDYRAKEESGVASRIGIIVAKVVVAIIVIAAIAVPWVVLMQKRIPGGLEERFRIDVLRRMTQPLEQHKGPPGYYLVFFLATFFPWVLFMPMAVKLAWRNRLDPLVRFSFAAVVGPWVMFECIQTKLPHYVLPCFPFLAILTALAVVAGIRGEHGDWRKRGAVVAAGIWAVIVVGLGAAPWAATAGHFGFDRLPYAGMAIVSVAAVACAAVVFVQFARRRLAAAAYAMAGTMFVVMGLLFTVYLPGARFLHLSEEVGAYLQSVGADRVGEVYMIDYKEDSLPFYQGGTIRPQPKNAFLATEPPERWPRFLVITREIWDATPEGARGRLEVLRTFRGWAYAAKGRVVDVMVLRKR